MDDKKIKVQVKGTAYTFKPLDMNEVARLGVIVAMDASQMILLKALLRIIQTAADKDEWDELTDRLAAHEVEPEDLVELFKKLSAKTAKVLSTDDDQ